MDRPLVILHGWSDESRSFHHLARLLEQELQRKPTLIDLGDYITLDDEVTYDDIVVAMARAWDKEKLPISPYSVDVLVHSTGGLIIRDWLNRFYTPEKAPIKHLVMLAPANFGSALAHRGRAFYGRIIKGRKSPGKFLNVGEQLLKGLELASPYSWQLAMRDRFGDHHFYGLGKVLCTVLVGNKGYSGISAAANEYGSDGIVRVSAANMNCALLEADFSKDPLKPTYHFRRSSGEVAFGIMDGENHSTVAGKDGGPKNPHTIDYITHALEIDDQHFMPWCEKLNRDTATIMANSETNNYKHGFQNTIVFVHDQFNNHVDDYFVEFFEAHEKKDWFGEMFHWEVIKSVHEYQYDKSYRCIYIDCTSLYQHLGKDWQTMGITLTAMPEFRKKGNVVGYRTFNEDDIGAVKFHKEQIPEIFVPNCSLLVRIIIKREQSEEVFQIHRLVE